MAEAEVLRREVEAINILFDSLPLFPSVQE
jgi:hypothetical protein